MKKKEKKVFEEIERIARENDCDENFINNFHGVYTFMHEAISDLPAMKQILIVVKAMTVGTKAQKIQLSYLAANLLKPKILTE